MNSATHHLGYGWRHGLALALAAGLASGAAHAQYVQQNLVSDLAGLAAFTDPNLKNPWGIAASPTGPFWVADNKTGVATLYNTAGAPQELVVAIPPPLSGTPPAAPTGQVFNGGTDFLLADGSPARFIFSSEDGTISAWNPASGRIAQLRVDNSSTSAIYKGLAIGNNGSGSLLYATNFHAGTVEAFDGNFSSASLSGKFTDPNIPAGYAPFGVNNINGQIYVTYALQDADKEDDVSGPGNGFVDAYDLNGNFLRRVASGGPLDSPWGLALAPDNFGKFSNALLIGNFGDGRINAFDPATDSFLGQLSDLSGNPIAINGLWGLIFGNGGNGGLTDHLYATAGIAGPDSIEDHGLFASLAPVPEPGNLPMLLLGGVALFLWTRPRYRSGPVPS